MKKTLLTITVGVLSFTCYGQNTPWSTTGNIGIGTISPAATLHVVSAGSSTNATAQYTGNLVIQGNSITGRSAVSGASLEFVVPANTDGSNAWGQGRIITVAGTTSNGDATGKMIFGTRRYYNKTGAGVNWHFGDDLVIDGAGQVGIGTTAPKATLQVTGTVLVKGANIDSRFAAGSNLSYLQSSGQMLIGWNRSAGGGETDFISNPGGGGTGGFSFYNYDDTGVMSQLLSIQGNGSIGVGTEITNGYKLAVKGSVVATSVKVQLMDVWPDYVFEKSYKRLSLSQLESYINKEKHLPEMPSAQAVSQDGIDLGDMNSKLLRKIEELTLYLIEKDNELKKQQIQIDQLTTAAQQFQMQQSQLIELKKQFSNILTKHDLQTTKRKLGKKNF